MNIILDFNPEMVSEESLHSLNPKIVGWKAYSLLKTACYLKKPEFQNIAQNITIPQGVVISSAVYDDYLKKRVVEKYLWKALKESIEEDPGLIEELADKAGIKGVKINRNKEEELKDLIDNIFNKINNLGLEKVLQKIVMEGENKINFVHYLSNILSRKLDDIKNEIEKKIPNDILNSLKVNISKKQLSPVIYLRSSSYSKKREEWIEHAGAFGSIPCFISKLDKKKIVWIYSRIFSSDNALQNIIKTGVNTFSMAILVQSVDSNISVSGNIISSKGNTQLHNYIFELYVEWKKGLDIPRDSIKGLITDGSIENVEVKGERYFSKMDSRELLFEANSGIYKKRWDIKDQRFLNHSKQEVFYERNLCIIIDIPFKKFNIETPDNREISEEILNELYFLATYFLKILNKSLEEKYQHIRIEFAITQDGNIQIVQCDPFEEKKKNE